MNHDVTDFRTQVLERSFQIPVLVDFWAEWCAPCRLLGPILERLAQKSGGKWELAKVNTEELPDISAAYGIQSIPNVKLISQGQVIGEFSGAMPEHMVVQWLEKYLPSKIKQELEEAKSFLNKGKMFDAQLLLQNILAEEPENIEAKVYLAKTLLFDSPEEANKLIEGIDEPKFNEVTETMKIFSRIFELESDSSVLPDAEIKPKYLAAIQSVRSQDFDSALEQFIDVIRADRYYDDDGSRKACIAIFKYLGEEHPITLKHRREFGSALYV
ncbi:MAG: tetratricopeptide repeat protein [Ignavibacteriae bacterium]|nr:tetratricopeptide repeat protein [Ignavibacteriota bacterium]